LNCAELRADFESNHVPRVKTEINTKRFTTLMVTVGYGFKCFQCVEEDSSLHEVPVVVVGQDGGDVPVPGGQGLQDVGAGVGLRNTGEKTSHETPPGRMQCVCVCVCVCVGWRDWPIERRYLGGGHGYVEELPAAALRDGSGQEELESVVGEKWSFVLEEKKKKR